MPMNADIKKIWTDKLREPGRTQGICLLRDLKNRQCCLDMLMEAGVEAGIQSSPVRQTLSYVYPVDSSPNYFGYEDVEKIILTQSVCDWAGLKDRDPSVSVPEHIIRKYHMTDYKDNIVTLTHLNDGMHVSFADIADIIDGDEEL